MKSGTLTGNTIQYMHKIYTNLVIPGTQLPERGVTSSPSLTRKILAAFVSDTNPSTSNITASAAPAAFAWILGCTKHPGARVGVKQQGGQRLS